MKMKMKHPLIRTLVLLFGFVAFTICCVPIFDFKQCERACRIHHHGAKNARLDAIMDNASVTGYRVGAEECACEVGGVRLPDRIPRYYPPHPPGYRGFFFLAFIPLEERSKTNPNLAAYPHKFHVVCGVDGVAYENAAAASYAGVKVVNCGKCGSCSSVRDVSLYRRYAKPMTKMLSQCALLYVFTSPYVGDSLARACLQSTFEGGFSEPCLNRFIDNYGCVVSHCYAECLFKWRNPLSSSNNDEQGVSHFSGKPDGTKLNPCMECDEMHCSPIFIESGGANRRMCESNRY